MSHDPRDPYRPPPQPPIAQHRPTQAAAAPSASPTWSVPTAGPYQPPPGPQPNPTAVLTAISITPSHQELREHAAQRNVRTITKKDEELFVREYVRTGRNEELAAKRIGLLDGQADKFLKRKRVQELLRTWSTICLGAQDITLDRVVQALGATAFLDRDTTYDEEGNPLPIKDLPIQAKQAIATVFNPVRRVHIDPETRQEVVTHPKYTFHNSQDALKTIAMILKPAATQNTSVTINQNQTTQINIESLSLEDLKRALHVQSAKPKEEPVYIDAECEAVE